MYGYPGLRVFPNPCTDRIQLEIRAESRVKTSWTLTDVSGRILMAEQPVDIGTGTSLISIPVSGYRKGLYFLDVRTDAGGQTFLINKQ
ncbi:MAG: T9SS type A sorting domain-containing protein [Bacteroidales bacterium]|nr:T9SS type A sorting domain-containing protein [Bacteroidales bacterium]